MTDLPSLLVSLIDWGFATCSEQVFLPSFSNCPVFLIRLLPHEQWVPAWYRSFSPDFSPIGRGRTSSQCLTLDLNSRRQTPQMRAALLPAWSCALALASHTHTHTLIGCADATMYLTCVGTFAVVSKQRERCHEP